MVMDMRPLVKFTYEMEGDRLEGLLLVEKMEELRSMGCQIKSCAPVLSNLAAVVRRDVELKPGVVISEYFGAPYFTTSTSRARSRRLARATPSFTRSSTRTAPPSRPRTTSCASGCP